MVHHTSNLQNVQFVIADLIEKVEELINTLEMQTDALRQRNINLPPMALNMLRATKTRLDKMNKEFTGSQIELRQLRALAGTTELITSTLDIDQVLSQVMDTVIQLTGAERGYIVLKNANSGEMEFRTARGLESEHVENNEFIVSRTIVNQVANTGQPVLTDNASTDERFEGQDSIVGFNLRSILAVPLLSRDEVIGVVYCDNRILSGLFRQHELNLMVAFGDQAAVAIENARLFENVREQLREISAIRDLMSNIFASVASGIITASNDGTVITVNPRAQTIIGKTEKEMVGFPLNKVVPSYSGTVAEAMRRVILEGKQQAVDLQPFIGKGGVRDWHIQITPLLDLNNNRSMGVTLVLDDLTDERKREEQLAQVRRYVPMAGLDTLKAADLAHIKVEVRQISAMFCDVRGFTSFSERLEPEDTMRIINRYLALASDAINLNEGIVDKYMGDAVTGLFNTQLNAQGDHANRAVRAALALMVDLYALHETLPEDQRLFYGTGIHTGQAVLGNIGGSGREEFSAMGEAMDISKVLQENAAKGEIILSKETYQLVKGEFLCEEFTPQKVKGYTQLTVAYRVKKRIGTGMLRL